MATPSRPYGLREGIPEARDGEADGGIGSEERGRRDAAERRGHERNDDVKRAAGRIGLPGDALEKEISIPLETTPIT
jgi:hypothetical protein